MRTLRLLSLGLVFATVAAAAADRPYVGKWKMNPAKSDFGETTVTYEQLPSGEMQSTAAGQSYKFRIDGKQYPATFGVDVVWKALSATSWQMDSKLKGKLLTTDTLTVSADGKTLTDNTKGTKPNGETIDDTTVFDRVSGGPGLAGKWKTKNLRSAAPSVLEFAASGADGLAIKIVDLDLACTGKLDGKDYPCTGPTLAPGWTAAFGNATANGIDVNLKMNGKPLFTLSYAVSADGRVLTERGTATAANEKTRVVYDRQ